MNRVMRSNRWAWLLNRLDGLRLRRDLLFRRSLCDEGHPLGIASMRCDRPAGHPGSHESRAFVSGRSPIGGTPE